MTLSELLAALTPLPNLPAAGYQSRRRGVLAEVMVKIRGGKEMKAIKAEALFDCKLELLLKRKLVTVVGMDPEPVPEPPAETKPEGDETNTGDGETTKPEEKTEGEIEETTGEGEGTIIGDPLPPTGDPDELLFNPEEAAAALLPMNPIEVPEGLRSLLPIEEPETPADLRSLEDTQPGPEATEPEADTHADTDPEPATEPS